MQSVLKKQDYFGQYGKIQKIVVNRHHPHGTGSSMSYSAYVTFARAEDATACVRGVGEFFFFLEKTGEKKSKDAK